MFLRIFLNYQFQSRIPVVQIVECPRDAMQGLPHFIPTQTKIDYLNLILQVGFHTIDFGSFVSPKAIPQLRDTAQVLDGLDNPGSQLLAIVANRRGAEDACAFEQINVLGYPFSISETFQQRNTNRSMADSVPLLEEIQELCLANNKTLLVYLSMGFGNPYGDPWSTEIVEEWTQKMADMNISHVALADTVGTSEPDIITDLFATLIPRFPEMTIGAHFHALESQRESKLTAAWEAGCRRFDVAANGFGGCPFAKDDLVGNISTESLLSFLEGQQALPDLNQDAWQQALEMAPSLFH